MNRSEFITFWLLGHGYPQHSLSMATPCRRIEWRYLGEGSRGS